MTGFSHENSMISSIYGRLARLVSEWRLAPALGERRPTAALDLLEARDDMLRDIGLLDGPDMALRRSELTLPSERPRR
jgi:hypothetical protein